MAEVIDYAAVAISQEAGVTAAIALGLLKDTDGDGVPDIVDDDDDNDGIPGAYTHARRGGARRGAVWHGMARMCVRMCMHLCTRT